MEKYIVLKEFYNYAVSNKGNVKNVKTGKQIKKVLNNGYLCVALCQNGKKRTFRVHRLVALMFLKNDRLKTQVNHKDGNKTNNSVDNLEWVTPSENILHAHKNKLIKTQKPVFLIKIETGETFTFCSTAECSRFLNVNNGSLNRVLKNERYSIKGYKAFYL